MSDSSNLVVAVGGGGSDGTGLVWLAPFGSAAPTDATTALDAAFLNVGGISEDGLTLDFEEDNTDIKFFGNRAIQRRVTNSESQTIQFTMMENNELSLATFFKKTLSSITPAVSTGAFSVTVGQAASVNYAFVGQIVDDTRITRIYAPKVEVSARESLTYSAGTPVQYGVTLTCYPVSGSSLIFYYALPNLG